MSERERPSVPGSPGEAPREGPWARLVVPHAGPWAGLNPTVKYTLGRVGLFVACALVLAPTPLNLFLKLMIALVVSFGLQFVVLRRWRQEMIGEVDRAMARRRREKEHLRAALAGEDADGEDEQE
jgi:hypothetical protein